MIKTTYQTPEIRNANDEIVQEGAFGKNTALSNATNDGWIDYVVNNLEALHDTIGDSAAHLDGNGHVVEPANLAIGDEDGNRLKTSYLKLTGGTVSGTLNVQQNLKIQDNQENVFGGMYVPSSSATEQFISIYGGESVSADGARLYLYPQNDGHFHLQAKSADGANTYVLKNTDNGGLFWRGYELAWKKDYLPLAGGTMTGNIMMSDNYANISSDSSSKYLRLMNADYNGGASLYLYGSNRAEQGRFAINAFDGTNRKTLTGYADGTLTWGSDAIALAKNYLPLAGGTMTGIITRNGFLAKNSVDNGYIEILGGTDETSSYICIYGKNHSTSPGTINIRAYDGTNSSYLKLVPNGTLTWGGNDITPQILTSLNPDDTDVPNNAVTTLATFTRTKGTWLVHIDANFQSNATGYRRIGIATSGTSIGMGRHWYASQQAVNGIGTVMSLTTFLTVSGASQTYYFNAHQTSGTQLTVGNGLQAFRVSSAV